MKKVLTGAILSVCLGFPSVIFAQDLGYRYDHNKNQCAKDGKFGFNPNFFGECGDVQQVPQPFGDYSGYSLKGAWIRDLDFSERDLSGMNFNLVVFKRNNFSRAIFDNSNLTKASLDQDQWNNASLKHVLAKAFTTWNVDMLSSNFSNSDFRDAEFLDTRLEKSVFDGANLQGTQFECSDMRKISFRNADLRNAFFTDSDFSGADVTGANLTNAAYDRCVKLPFLEWTAKKRGMVKVSRQVPCRAIRYDSNPGCYIP